MKTRGMNIRTLALAAALPLLAMASCTLQRADKDPEQGSEIMLGASFRRESTKGLMSSSSFQTAGNALRVWDVYTNDETAPLLYIDGAYAVCDGTSATWGFREGAGLASEDIHYYWTFTGLHSFFGALARDCSSGSAVDVPSAWDFDAGTMSFVIPQTRVSRDEGQLDFVYSDILRRDRDAGGNTAPVQLELGHLLSSYAVTLTNTGFYDVNVTSVTMRTVESGSAVIDYSAAWSRSGNASASISLSDDIASSTYAVSDTVAHGNTVDLFTGAAVSGTPDITLYSLAWPQRLQDKYIDITCSSQVNVEFEYWVWGGEGGYSLTGADVGDGAGDYSIESGHYVYVGAGAGAYTVTATADPSGEYSYRTDTRVETVSTTYSVNLGTADADVTSWASGRKYLYNLVVKGVVLDVDVTVMNWDGGHGGSVTFE